MATANMYTQAYTHTYMYKCTQTCNVNVMYRCVHLVPTPTSIWIIVHYLRGPFFAKQRC